MAQFKITKIQVRRDSAADWTSNNTVLDAGEFGYETDTGKLKIGNGTTAWTALSYLDTGGGGGGGFTEEEIEDIVNGLIVAGTGITKTYDDAGNLLTIGLTGVSYSSAEQTKLSNIEDGAEVNRTPAELVTALDTQLGSNAWQSKLTQEEVQDFMASALTGGSQTNIAVTYNDATNVFDFFVSASGGAGLTQEEIEDLVAGFIINGTGISKVYDDVTGQLTLSLSNEIYTTSEKNKLAAIEAGATADQTPAEIETAYNSQVATVSQVDAEAGTSTTVYRWTPERVAQAIAALETTPTVSKVGTPVDNQIGVWTGDGTIEGTANLTYNGTSLGVTGNITVTGTVDGRDISTDGLKLDTAIISDVTGVTGADAVTNIMTLTQAEYDAIVSPNASTLYFVTDASYEYLQFAISDMSTALTVGDNKGFLPIPFNCTIHEVIVDLVTAPTGSGITIDIEKEGASIFSTLLTVDVTEDTSRTAATPAVISSASAIAGDRIIANIDAVGSTVAGAGAVITLRVERT